MRFAIENWLRRWWYARRPAGRTMRAAAACLTVSLATAWQSPAEAVTVHLEVTPSEDVFQAYALYSNYVLNSSPGGRFFALGDLAAGVTAEFDHDIPDWTDEEVLGPTAGYTVVALHGPPENRGISLSMFDDSLITSGGTWESFLADSGYNPVSTEQEIVNAWSLDQAYHLFTGLRFEIRLPFGVTATMVNLSDAAFGGTAIATVPEPGTWILLVAGAGILLVARRSRE